MFLQTSKNISVHTAIKRFAHTEKLRSAKFRLNNNVKTVSKLSKNICRGENNYPLRFTQVNSLVVQQNGTCPCAVNALLQLQISVWYGNKTSNVHANCHSFKKKLQLYYRRKERLCVQ